MLMPADRPYHARMNPSCPLSRRNLLRGAGCVALIGLSGAVRASSVLDGAREVVSVKDFGAVSRPGRDNTAAIQAAVDAVQSRGGGVVVIPEVYECGNIVVRRDGVQFHGPGAWLVNGRITIQNGREGCGIEGLGIVDRRGDDSTFLLDIGGRHCTFTDVSLIKDPIAGGYQMYLGMAASDCTFRGLTMRGSNGAFVGGSNHLFEDFDLESTMSTRIGGDDAFAIKAIDGPSSNLVFRRGKVRGYSALASIGSEVGTFGRNSRGLGVVRNVQVSDVAAEGCEALVYIKPGGLETDWRDGLVEQVTLDNLTLTDLTGFKYAKGVHLSAGHGATIRGVRGRNLTIRARARSQGVLETNALDINLLDLGAPARIEDIDLQLAFADPYDGEAHGPGRPGYPIEHVARVEKRDPAKGTIRNVSLDIAGRGSRRGGIYVGGGLDDAVRIRRARLTRVAVNPQASVGGGGIWSDSRIALGDVEVQPVKNGTFGGRGLARRAS